jgi:hypothetical protein
VRSVVMEEDSSGEEVKEKEGAHQNEKHKVI